MQYKIEKVKNSIKALLVLGQEQSEKQHCLKYNVMEHTLGSTMCSRIYIKYMLHLENGFLQNSIAFRNGQTLVASCIGHFDCDSILIALKFNWC